MTKHTRDANETSWICACNREFEQTGIYCHQCGHPKPQARRYICPKCQNDKIDEQKHKFCDQCGTKVTILPKVARCAWLDVFLQSPMFEYHKDFPNAAEDDDGCWVMDEFTFRREFDQFTQRHASLARRNQMPTQAEYRVTLNEKGCFWDDAQKMIYGLRINDEKARKIEELERENWSDPQPSYRAGKPCPHRFLQWCSGDWDCQPCSCT